jgi:hypothetical protein
MYRNSVEMFEFFWEELGGSLWNENSFDSLFKLLAKRDLAKFLKSLFKSQTTLAIFYGMSHQYRYTFIDNILNTKQIMLDELINVTEDYY